MVFAEMWVNSHDTVLKYPQVTVVRHLSTVRSTWMELG